jgi:hypothetical protein
MKLLAINSLVRIIIRYPSKDQGRGLSRSAGRIIISIINIYICRKNNKSFVCLISYFLVICINTEIILGLVKTFKTNN